MAVNMASGLWLWVYHNKIPIYSIFCLRKGDYNSRSPSLVVFPPLFLTSAFSFAWILFRVLRNVRLKEKGRGPGSAGVLGTSMQGSGFGVSVPKIKIQNLFSGPFCV